MVLDPRKFYTLEEALEFLTESPEKLTREVTKNDEMNDVENDDEMNDVENDQNDYEMNDVENNQNDYEMNDVENNQNDYEMNVENDQNDVEMNDVENDMDDSGVQFEVGFSQLRVMDDMCTDALKLIEGVNDIMDPTENLNL